MKLTPNLRFLLTTLILLGLGTYVGAQGLESQLNGEGAAALAKAASQQGDAKRGAVVFYQQYMSCTKCHLAGDKASPLGPDLSKVGKEVTNEHLVESVLNPSKVLAKGFEPVTVQTDEGKTIVGLFASETNDALVLRDPSRDGKLINISKDSIEARANGKLSIMPAGQVNLLASRQQFLDLTRYLMEIRDGGPAKALALEPPPSLYAARPLPEYEKNIDHAGVISSFDAASMKRGSDIYNRVCANCHGTVDKPGSLPTSLRFAQGKFKSGSDPYTMYQTLTRGFGLMVPQTWMVPEQKYDVIHYIRETYLKKHNETQYTKVDADYLAGLPQGDTRGPKPSKINLWEQMDYGPNLVMTMEVGNNASNFAYKGNAIRLDHGQGGVSRGKYWMIYDYDTLRVAAGWSGDSFCDWAGINFNGRHNIHPRLTGDLHFANPTGPGWANPEDGSFEDVRLVGRDKRIYGPLPRKWAQYKGMYYHGNDTLIEYTVGETNVLELPGLEVTEQGPVYKRTFNIGPRKKDIVLQVTDRPESKGRLEITQAPAVVVLGTDVVAGVAGDTKGLQWLSTEAGKLRLKIPAGDKSVRFTMWLGDVEGAEKVKPLVDALVLNDANADLSPLTKGGPRRWPDVLTTKAKIGDNDGPFSIDVLTRPAVNPWFCRMRLTGFDFLPDGDGMIVSAWDGSVWLVGGIKALDNAKPGDEPELTWQRICSGLFQPLGVRIVDGKIYVTCRDQLAVLHDLNGDLETDYVECLNNDHQVTDHFHEFAMGLQTDDKGNFYYAKSARHALTALVPHHGTLLRISKDGETTEILAKGFRAANGVCLNPDGTYIVTDQEGHWNPKNRINYVKEGGFYGNMYGYHDVTDSSDEAMEQPLCWITNSFDRSPAELLWVDSDRWGPLKGTLLNLSYGYGKVFTVPHEKIDGQAQGGMSPLPIPQFPTGVMRGRFNKGDGQLYVGGMFAWAGSRNQPGGLYRLNYTGKPVYVATSMSATKKGVEIKFSGKLDPSSLKAENFAVKVWDLRRTKSYGSKHYNEHALKVTSSKLSSDGLSLILDIPEIKPTWGMEIKYRLKGADGKDVDGVIHNTIHTLR